MGSREHRQPLLYPAVPRSQPRVLTFLARTGELNEPSSDGFQKSPALICSLLPKASVARVSAKPHTSPLPLPSVALGTSGLKVLVALLLGSPPLRPPGWGGRRPEAAPRKRCQGLRMTGLEERPSQPGGIGQDQDPRLQSPPWYYFLFTCIIFFKLSFTPSFSLPF